MKGEKRDEKRKKYLFILLGFLMAICISIQYQHFVGGSENAVSYQYIDEDTGEILKKKRNNTDKQAGKAYEATQDGKKSMVLKKRKWYKNE